MNTDVTAWLDYAKRDFEDAQALIDVKRYHGALLFLQQAVEKSIKAFLLYKNIKKVPFVHDIRYLLEMTKLEAPKEMELDIKELSLVYTRIRYPDMNKAYYTDTELVKKLVEQFINLYSWIQTQFKDK